MFTHFVFAVLAASIATSAASQSSGIPTESSEDIVLGAWSDPAVCSHRNAVHLSFHQVVAGGERLNGRCVAVEGFWVSRALFEREGQGNSARSHVSPSLRNRRIGIYARDEILENSPQRSTRYMMIGVVGQCETEWPDAIMVLGYCHYTGGPILKVAETIRLATASGS